MAGFIMDSTKVVFVDKLTELEKIIKENDHAVKQNKNDDDDKIAKKYVNGASVQ